MTIKDDLYKQLNISLKQNYEINKKLGLDTFLKKARKYFLNIANVENAINDLLICNELDSEDKIKNYYNRIKKEQPKNNTLDSDYYNGLLDEYYKRLTYKDFKKILEYRDNNYRDVLNNIKNDQVKYKKLVNLATSTNALKGTKGIIKDYMLDEDRLFSYVYYPRSNERDPNVEFIDAMFIYSLHLEYYERMFIKLSLNFINDKFKVSNDLIKDSYKEGEDKAHEEYINSLGNYYKTLDKNSFFNMITANFIYNKIRNNLSVINFAVLEIREERTKDKQLGLFSDEEYNKIKTFTYGDSYSYLSGGIADKLAKAPIQQKPTNNNLPINILNRLKGELDEGDKQALALDHNLDIKISEQLDQLDKFILETICKKIYEEEKRTCFSDRQLARYYSQTTGHTDAETSIIDAVNRSIKKLKKINIDYYLESTGEINGVKADKVHINYDGLINVTTVTQERLLTSKELKDQISEEDLKESKTKVTTWYLLRDADFSRFTKDLGLTYSVANRYNIVTRTKGQKKTAKIQQLRYYLNNVLTDYYNKGETILDIDVNNIYKVYEYDKNTDNKSKLRARDDAKRFINSVALEFNLKPRSSDNEDINQYVEDIPDLTKSHGIALLRVIFKEHKEDK